MGRIWSDAELRVTEWPCSAPRRRPNPSQRLPPLLAGRDSAFLTSRRAFCSHRAPAPATSSTRKAFSHFLPRTPTRRVSVSTLSPLPKLPSFSYGSRRSRPQIQKDTPPSRRLPFLHSANSSDPLPRAIYPNRLYRFGDKPPRFAEPRLATMQTGEKLQLRVSRATT